MNHLYLEIYVFLEIRHRIFSTLELPSKYRNVVEFLQKDCEVFQIDILIQFFNIKVMSLEFQHLVNLMMKIRHGPIV